MYIATTKSIKSQPQYSTLVLVIIYPIKIVIKTAQHNIVTANEVRILQAFTINAYFMFVLLFVKCMKKYIDMKASTLVSTEMKQMIKVVLKSHILILETISLLRVE